MAKSTTKTKLAALPVPAHVQGIWDTLKGKAQQQLFHGDPAKRGEAVRALIDKLFDYERRNTLLLAAALDEPDADLRAQILSGVAQTGRYLPWVEVQRLRAAVDRLSTDSSADVRDALARCMESAGAPTIERDLDWLSPLLALEGEQPWPLDDTTQRRLLATLALVVRLAREGSDRALREYVRAVEHPVVGRFALWSLGELGERKREVISTLIALAAGGGPTASAAATALVFAPELLSPDERRAAIEAIERLRDGGAEPAWEYDLMAAILAPERLASVIAAHADAIEASDITRPGYGVAIEALSYAPEAARPHVATHARSVLCSVGNVPRETMQRWVRGNPSLVADAIESKALDVYDGPKLFAWWAMTRPERATADALRGIVAVLDGHPKGTLTFQEQQLCEACCAVLEREPVRTREARATLARVGARQAAHLLSSVLPTVRAMHRADATREDFAPIAAVYDAQARASDARELTANPAFDVERGWGSMLRATARVLPALRDADTLAAQWDDVMRVWNYGFEVTSSHLLLALAPFASMPAVREMTESGLTHRSGELQRACARALGLLPHE